MNFNDITLLTRHGTWVKVQVAFYDFIMKHALGGLKTTPEEFNDFKDEGPTYDQMIAKVEDEFPSVEDAWNAFLTHDKL